MLICYARQYKPLLDRPGIAGRAPADVARESFGAGRRALRFGRQKIKFHVKGREFAPEAHLPVPRTGAVGPLRSIPPRDTALNLIEIPALA